MKSLRLRGLFPAPAVPFDDDLNIVEPEYRRHIEYLSSVDGVGGVVVNGHAGEVTTLTPAERQRIVEMAREAAPSEILVVAGVEALSTAEAIQRAREAKAAGADAALVLPPFDYFPRRAMTRTPDAPYRFFSDLAEAVDLPLIVFQYPVFTGVSYTTEVLVRLAEIDSVVAVKNAAWNVSVYAEQYAALKGKVSVLAACDAPELLAMMEIGADGALIGISNVATELWAQFVTSCLNREFDKAARLFVERLMPITEDVFGDVEKSPTSFNAATKEALVQLGRFSTSRVRPPELDVTVEERARIRDGLRRAGLLTE